MPRIKYTLPSKGCYVIVCIHIGLYFFYYIAWKLLISYYILQFGVIQFYCVHLSKSEAQLRVSKIVLG